MGFGVGILDDEFVGGGAAGVLAGQDDQRAVLGDMTFAAADRFLVKRGRVQIPVARLSDCESPRFKAMADILCSVKLCK